MQNTYKMKKNFTNTHDNQFRYFLSLTFFLILCTESFTQYRPPLFFREDWKEIPAAIPLTQDHVSNINLVVNLYGQGADSIKKSNHDRPVDDPFYVWSGLCNGNWAVSLNIRIIMPI